MRIFSKIRHSLTVNLSSRERRHLRKVSRKSIRSFSLPAIHDDERNPNSLPILPLTDRWPDRGSFNDMRSLEEKIAKLEDMISDTDKMNAAIFDLVESADLNNDDQISKAEFQMVLQDFGIADFEAVEDLFVSLDRDGNGKISFREFRPFFRAQTKIKLHHMKELKLMRDTAPPSKSPSGSGSSSSSSKKKKKDTSLFGRWKSTKN